MKRRLFIVLLCLFSVTLWANEDFPGRAKYPHVPYLELEELYAQRNGVVIIDARSPFEYETLRIKNAVSIPLVLNSTLFKKKMQELREDNPNKKLVFYCNGHNCMKSYKAAQRSITYGGGHNIYAFDAGIFDWASKYPNEALLLGGTLRDADKLISKNSFKSHMMDAEKFIKSASADESIAVLDIRDRIERDGFYIFSGFEKSISLNLKDKAEMAVFFEKVKKNNQTLYIYDMVGKQVRWFQYFVEEQGIKNYYFMEGGSEAFFDIPFSHFVD